MREKLFGTLQNTSKNSRFVEIMEKRKKRDKVVPDVSITCMPLSILEAKETFTANADLTMMENVLAFTGLITLSDQQRFDLYTATKDQASSNLWHEQRKGRITASKFHAVKTRSETLMRDFSKTPDVLVKSLIERPKFETRATKHGIAMECHAIRKLVSILKSTHSGIEHNTPGLTVSGTCPF